MALPRTLVSIVGWGLEHSHRDYLPAWTTVFETIDSEHLYGLKRDFARVSVEDAYQALTDGFAKVRTPPSDNGWLALTCRPISFRGSSAEPAVLTGELTGWRSFALVDGRVVDDRVYAFDPPPGFQTEVARHTLSWDGHFHVDPARDLALQLHAKTPLTPAFRQRSQSLQKNAEGQLLQWSCATTSLPQLEETLRSVGLVFSLIDQFSTDDIATGVIHDPMFIVDSDFSAMPMARDWDTFDQGAVRKALRKLPQGGLPGKEAGVDVLEFALGQVPWMVLNPPETFYSHEHDTPIGLPVNLMERELLVERFHALTNNLEELKLVDQIEGAKRELRTTCPSLDDASLSFEPFNTDIYPIVRLALSWHPPLGLSSADAFLSVEQRLLEVFDRLLPRRTLVGMGPHGTMDVLKVAGNIHFNPDYWDHYRTSD